MLAGMDLADLTWEPERLDRWMRVETSVDLLRGELPRTRMVCFGRARPLLAVHARAREPGEDWDEHVSEALFLGRSLRPAAVAVGVTMRNTDLDDPGAHLLLVVATAVRRLSGRPLVDVRAHPYRPDAEGLTEWLPLPDDPEVPEQLAALPLCALRRGSRRARRCPYLVADHLRSRGHRLDATPAVAARLRVQPTGGA